MVNWQVTATTIYCDAVDDEVTLLVNKDGSAQCIAYQRYGEPDKETVKLMRKKESQLKRHLACEGPECYRLTQYRDQMFAEEARRGTKGE